MTTSITAVMYALIDLAALMALVGACYLPRHRNTELAIALVTVNVGVFAVTQVLAADSIGAGIGLGLFGVLSIIRLRSTEISQRNVAYYFAALATALVCGLANSPWSAAALSGAIVLVLAAADSPKLHRKLNLRAADQPRQRTVTLVLDQAEGDLMVLRARAAAALQCEPTAHGDHNRPALLGLSITKLDHINDCTHVTADVRYPSARDTENSSPLRVTEQVSTR